MLVNIDIQFPKDVASTMRGAADSRASFRKTMENRMRPRMDALASRVRRVAKYQKLSDFYELEQKSTEDSIAFALINTNIHSRFLLAPHGTRAHLIPRAFGRPGAVKHPGKKPDQPVFDAISEAEPDLLGAVADGGDKWARSMGTESF